MSTTPSFWLDQLGSRPSRPALAGDREADVCIIGGGFTGLWTAYELKRADPSLVVVVLEGRQVGFGASGRNGGWVLGKVSGTVDAWRARGGPDAPRAMVRAIQQTVEEIGAVVAVEDIECDWKHGGTVTVAQSDTQLARLRAVVDAERRELGEDLAWQLLDADAIAGRINVDGARGALFTPHCARVQPARLVDGLAAAAERAGVDHLRVQPGQGDRAGPRRDQGRRRAGPLRPARHGGLHRRHARRAPGAAADEQLDDRHRAAARGRVGADRLGRRGDHARRLPPLHLLPADGRRADRHRRARRARTASGRAPTARDRSRAARSTSCGPG